VADDVLVQSVVLGQQDDRRFPPASPDSPSPLPGGHHRARIAHQNTQVEPSNVDSQLESAGGDDGGKFPAGQLLLDHPPFLGQKTGAIGTDPAGQLRRHAQDAHVNQFSDFAGLGEGDGLEPGLGGPGEQLGRQGRGVAVLPFFGFEEHEVAPGLRGTAAVNDIQVLFLPADELLSEFPGVGNGCGKHDELGTGPVEMADSLQPTKDLRHMTAEYPPVGVQFVDHLVWWGRIPWCSMSGLVTTTSPRVRTALRASPGVSPSKVKARTPSPPARLSSVSSAT